IHPQIYRRDFESYRQIIDRLVTEQFTAEQLPKLAPGILLKLGSYRISPEYLLQAIEYNRSRGIPGEVFFFYEGLRENNNALGKVLQSGPYAQPASLPSLADLSQNRVSNRRPSKFWDGQRLRSLFKNRF
ncbi:MAG TPA: hypothetical protein V6D03_02545, partial [Candidatus Caenarcaniphilales bacterium]